MRPVISFDWAIKRLLRQKANYGILEGFLSELLKEDVEIQHIPESESNPEHALDKTNKVDIVCINQKGEIFLIELQYYSEHDYFHRMLYGTSKLITDYLKAGEPYGQVKKVYSINIVYFDLGQGLDYIYHAKNVFLGLHHDDILQFNKNQVEKFGKTQIHQIYPEYFIIKVNNFDNIAKESLDEWVYYLKNNDLPVAFKAKGLEKVEAQLKVDAMTITEKINYEAHLKNLAISQSMLETAQMEGKSEGRIEGKLEGKLEGKIQKAKFVANKLIIRGFTNGDIAELTGLGIEEIKTLRKELN